MGNISWKNIFATLRSANELSKPNEIAMKFSHNAQFGRLHRWQRFRSFEIPVTRQRSELFSK